MAELAMQLFEAAEEGNLEALLACVAAGADPNQLHATTGGAVAPLHAACWAGHAHCAAALLIVGADLEVPGVFGLRPLHYAAGEGHLACLQQLLASGAEVDARSRRGATPLYEAAMDEPSEGRDGCVAALLAAGASPSVLGPDGWTPIAAAAQHGRLEPLQQMLAADPAAALLKTDAGQLPLGLALEQGHLLSARALLADGVLPPLSEVLSLLGREGAWGQPLYATLAARQPLTVTEWAAVPSPCRGLGAALPAVLARSEDEAAALVRHLADTYRQRLGTFALCLARAQRLVGVELPLPLVRSLLALSMAN